MSNSNRRKKYTHPAKYVLSNSVWFWLTAVIAALILEYLILKHTNQLMRYLLELEERSLSTWTFFI